MHGNHFGVCGLLVSRSQTTPSVSLEAWRVWSAYVRLVASPVSRFCSFSFALKTAKMSLQTMGGQKIESAQKNHASRGCCERHAN